LRHSRPAATIVGVRRELPFDREDVKTFLLLMADTLAELRNIRRLLDDGEEEEENGFRE